MSGGGGSKTQDTTQRIVLPDWLDQAAQDTLKFGNEVAARPYDAYGGQQIAGMTPDQLAAMDAVRGQQGVTSGALSHLAGQAAGYGQAAVPQVRAGSVAGTNLAPYMDPYLGQVETGALSSLNRQRMTAQQGLEDRAAGAGAFGGSRLALQQGQLDADASRAAGELSGQLRSQAFNTALQTATGDVTRAQQASTTNQAAYLQNLGLGLQGTQLAGQLTGAAGDARRNEIDALAAVGGQQQAYNQAGLDLARQQWQTQRDYPLQQLQTRLSVLGGTPYGQTQISQTPMQGGNPAMGALGGAASGAAMGPMIMPGWGTAIGAVAGGAMGFFGSRR